MTFVKYFMGVATIATLASAVPTQALGIVNGSFEADSLSPNNIVGEYIDA